MAPKKDDPAPDVVDEAEPLPATVRVVVAAGRSLMGQVKIGDKIVDGKRVPVYVHQRFAAGEMCEIPIEDLPHLSAAGFVGGGVPIAPAPPAMISTEEVRPTVNGNDGSVIQGS